MKIIFEPEPSERVNIVTMTEAFINAVYSTTDVHINKLEETTILRLGANEIKCAIDILRAEYNKCIGFLDIMEDEQ